MKSNILVCPLCKGPLLSAAEGYSCAACAREYPIVDGVSDFFVSEGVDEENPVWRENRVWLDPQMVEARDIIYRLSVPELKGMAFAMQQLAARTFPGCRILEVGAGTGHLTRWMADVAALGTEIYALDFSWPMFAKARANIAGHPGVTLLWANATGRLPFCDERFDLVFLRLAPLGENGISNVQAAFQLLKPGGWLFKAGWNPKQSESASIEEAIQLGYESAEVHVWHYPRARTREEYAASRAECERAIAFGASFKSLPVEPESLTSMIWENLRIAQKPS